MAKEEKHTVFKPSVHGFHFHNSFHMLTLPFLGDKNIGLCGGMVWAALDRYYGHTRKPIPPRTTQPPTGGNIFNELFGRQLDSMRLSVTGSEILNECLEWMARPNEGHILHPLHSIGYLVQKDEWPAVKALLDKGYPASLCLITVRVGNPAKNHQVLAIGYIWDKSKKAVKIEVYDPNFPDEIVTLSFNLGRKNSKLSAKHSKGKPFRGFFHWSYDKKRIAPPPNEGVQREIPKQKDPEFFWVMY